MALNVFLWFLCALLALGIVAWLRAFVREKLLGRKPASFRLHSHRCHLGSPGAGVSLRFRREGHSLVLQTARSYYVFLLLVTFLFGPGLTALFVAAPEGFESPPLPVAIMAGMLSVLASIAFVQTCWTVAFRLPRIEVDPHEIRLLRGSERVAAILRQDLVSLDEEVTIYRSKNREHPNYGLLAATGSGKRLSLWVVSDLARHEEAKAELESVLDLPPAKPVAAPLSRDVVAYLEAPATY